MIKLTNGCHDKNSNNETKLKQHHTRNNTLCFTTIFGKIFIQNQQISTHRERKKVYK